MSEETLSESPAGVLLVNLGSPDAPTPAAVRRFLDEFLGDPAVVDRNPLLWWLVRKLIILPRRGRSSAELYRSVWTPEGSPLIHGTLEQARLLASRLGAERRVAVGMRYGTPSLAAGLDELADAGCRRVLLLPMFPQYSATTTGSIETEARRWLARRGGDVQLQVVPPYYEDPGYVRALAAVVRSCDRGVEHYVFSFHGLPVRYVEAGDPYRDHCEATARALARELGLADDAWDLAYQSRFGPERWLEPDTAELVPALSRTKSRVLVTCPGFPTDCLETLEEIALRLPKACAAAGGGELVVAPCLNAHPAWIEALEGLLDNQPAGLASGRSTP